MSMKQFASKQFLVMPASMSFACGFYDLKINILANTIE